MMTDKPVNYTPEQTAQLVANYKAGATVEVLAEMFGKTTRSVVAKLSREGVYTAKNKASGVARVKKSSWLIVLPTELVWLQRLLIASKRLIMRYWKQSSQTCADCGG